MKKTREFFVKNKRKGVTVRRFCGIIKRTEPCRLAFFAYLWYTVLVELQTIILPASLRKPGFAGVSERYSEGSALRLPPKGHCPFGIPYQISISPQRGDMEICRGEPEGITSPRQGCGGGAPTMPTTTPADPGSPGRGNETKSKGTDCNDQTDS